jgi:small subunit ribosomal protein S3
MGQKGHPKGFRLPIRRDWDSRYFAKKSDLPLQLESDHCIRTFLKKKLPAATVSRIEIERAGSRVRVTLHTARPGVVIGRKGQELDKLREELRKEALRPFGAQAKDQAGLDLILDVQEIRNPDLDPQTVAENVALQIERRVAYRRALKKAVQLAMSKGAKGVRIKCSGRLNGADIARTEQQSVGSIPLHTLKANVNYGFAEAATLAGLIGVRCLIHT